MSWEGLNRRKFPRINFPCLIKIAEKNHAMEALLTHTENISVGGVGIIIKRQLELFSPMVIEIDLIDGEDPIFCLGKIVWVVRRKATEESKPSYYDTGVEFVDIKPTDRARIERAVEHVVKSLNKAKL